MSVHESIALLSSLRIFAGESTDPAIARFCPAIAPWIGLNYTLEILLLKVCRVSSCFVPPSSLRRKRICQCFTCSLLVHGYPVLAGCARGGLFRPGATRPHQWTGWRRLARVHCRAGPSPPWLLPHQSLRVKCTAFSAYPLLLHGIHHALAFLAGTVSISPFPGGRRSMDTPH